MTIRYSVFIILSLISIYLLSQGHNAQSAFTSTMSLVVFALAIHQKPLHLVDSPSDT